MHYFKNPFALASALSAFDKKRAAPIGAGIIGALALISVQAPSRAAAEEGSPSTAQADPLAAAMPAGPAADPAQTVSVVGDASFTPSTERPTEDQVFAAICAAGIAHPDIAMRQVLLETGRLTGPMLMGRNNLFGFRHNQYLSFANWRDSVAYYKRWQDKRYVDPSENYFHFLTRIRYARGDYRSHVMRHDWDESCPANTTVAQALPAPSIALR